MTDEQITTPLRTYPLSDLSMTDGEFRRALGELPAWRLRESERRQRRMLAVVQDSIFHSVKLNGDIDAEYFLRLLNCQGYVIMGNDQ